MALLWFCGLLGCFLLLTNIWGLYQGPDVWFKPQKVYKSKNHEPFSRENFNIERKAGESDFDYVKRMTLYVHDLSIHYFEKENRYDNIHIMVAPFAWCWPLWLRGLWAAYSGNKFSVEFCNAEKALERGYGYCSQRSVALQDILRRKGFKAKTRDLYGHVVCTAMVEGREVLLDPDYRIAAQESLEDFHQNPELLLKYIDSDIYLNAYQNNLRPIYAAARWRERGDREYACRSDLEIFLWRAIQWGIPLILVFFSIHGLIRARKNVARRA